jgi:deoxyribonuclease-1
MKRLIVSLCIVLSFFVTVNVQGQLPRNFTEAKKITYQIHSRLSHKKTFYCNCRYSNHKTVDFGSCGYIPRKNKKRAQRVEIEHIVPTSVFGYSRRCWREPICRKKNGKHYKGRKCCEKIDPIFRKMESDLHNLVPVIGEINGDRRDYTFAIVEKNPYQYGTCPFVVDFTSKRVEPPDYTRGFIARTYLYMHKTYDIPISKKQMKLFRNWDQRYTVTTWEIERNQLIKDLKILPKHEEI